MLKNPKHLLIASTVLNVLLFGLLTWGAVYHVHAEGQRWAVVKAQLSPEVRHQVSRGLQRLHSDVAKAERREDKARTKLLKVMQARDFKAKRYDQVVETFAKARSGLAEKKSAGYKEILATLSREDRMKLAEHLVRHYEGGDQELRSDVAAEMKAAHKKEAWWNK